MIRVSNARDAVLFLSVTIKQLNQEGYSNIGFAHFNYINPLPKNTEEVLRKFRKIVVCELNSGQFAKILKINFNGLELSQYNKVQGLPFGNEELVQQFKQLLA